MTVYKCEAASSILSWSHRYRNWKIYSNDIPYLLGAPATVDQSSTQIVGTCAASRGYSTGTSGSSVGLFAAPVTQAEIRTVFNDALTLLGSDWVDNLDATATSRAKSKMNNASAAVLSTIGEASETVRLFPKSLRLIKDMLLTFRGRAIARTSKDVFDLWRTGCLSRALPQYKLLANMWLQYRYGFRPLVYDVHNLTKAALTQLSSPRITCRGSAYGRSAYTRSSTVYGYGAKTPIATCKTATSVQSSSRAGVLCDVDIDIANLLAVRLGCEQFLTTAWDLIPLSFVVDWFIDVSSYLTQLSFATGFNPRGAWVTSETVILQNMATVMNNVSYWSHVSYQTQLNEYSNAVSGSPYVRLSRRRRLVVDASSYSIPGLSPRISLASITDLIAIVTGIFL